MNNTKWNELRLAMFSVDPAPLWSTLVVNGYHSKPDREWYYHFRTGGYEDIVHVDIFADNDLHRDQIRVALQKINLPGNETKEGFRVFGYVDIGQEVSYL